MLSVSSKKLCSKTIKASSSTIGHNGDILVNILYFLPVKSICVFKTVSQQWLSLISDPYFKRIYNRHSCRLKKPALFMKKIVINRRESEFETLVMDERNGIDYIPFSNPIAVNRKTLIELLHSCNGLVLREVQDASTDYHRNYVIYNPSMMHCKTLPPLPFKNARVPYILSLTIAFDPAKSSYYEVVSVCNADISEDVLHIEIYSSETDSWRDAGDPFDFSPIGNSESGMYWNGSVHWIDEFTATLHYFDIDCALMKTVAMPTQPYSIGDHSRCIEYFGECRGQMHLMEMRKDDMPRADIWEMQMDYSGWNAKYSVDLSPLITVYPSILLERTHFGFELDVLLIEEGDDSSRLILRVEKDKVISFDLDNKNFKEMYDASPRVCIHAFQYIEILSHA